jgi:hypothetical protein
MTVPGCRSLPLHLMIAKLKLLNLKLCLFSPYHSVATVSSALHHKLNLNAVTQPNKISENSEALNLKLVDHALCMHDMSHFSHAESTIQRSRRCDGGMKLIFIGHCLAQRTFWSGDEADSYSYPSTSS